MNLDKTKKIKRIIFGRGYEDVMEIPNLVDIQLSSYERFLQRKTLLKGEPPLKQGLEEVFQSTFPIESPNGDMLLEYCGFTLDEQNIKFGEQECKQKGLTFAIPLKAKINLIFLNTGEIRQKEIYMGDIPIMTEKGTFVVNGAERVVVSQIHRSPGVIFSHEKGRVLLPHHSLPRLVAGVRDRPEEGADLREDRPQEEDPGHHFPPRPRVRDAGIHHRAVLPGREGEDHRHPRGQGAPCRAELRARRHGEGRGAPRRSSTGRATRSTRTTWKSSSTRG